MHGDTRHYSILRKVSTVNIPTCHSNTALHCMQHPAGCTVQDIHHNSFVLFFDTLHGRVTSHTALNDRSHCFTKYSIRDTTFAQDH
jgi:hypothetical protein